MSEEKPPAGLNQCQMTFIDDIKKALAAEFRATLGDANLADALADVLADALADVFWAVVSTWAPNRTTSNAATMSAAPDMLNELRACAAIFREYEALHRDKGTPEGDAKADANAAHAARCEALIAKAEGAR